MQTLTFLLLATLAIILGPTALGWLRSDKQILATPLFMAMLSYAFLETQFAFWTTLL